MKPIIAAPLVAVALAGAGVGAYIAVAGAGSGEEAPAVQATSTPTPSPAEQPSATPTPEPTATPVPTPEGGQAPKGCLSTELAYVDPDGRFAFCYPADMELTTAQTGYGTAVTVQYPINESNRVTVNAGGRVEPYSPCAIQSSAIVANQTVKDFLIDGRTVQACFRDHYDPVRSDLLLRKTIDFMVPTTDGRPVIFFVVYSGPDFQRQGIAVGDIALRILDSAAIY